MGTTQPIRNKENVRLMRDFYFTVEPNPRNYALIALGLNSALRISDLLHLKWDDVWAEPTERFRKHLALTEQKTGKSQTILLNENATSALAYFRETLPHPSPDDYVFIGRNNGEPLCRSQAYRIVRHAADALSLGENISCHSLRKTFGYHAWKMGTQPAVLMSIYNHSSFAVTMRYLGIEQEDKDEVFSKINL